MYLHQDYGSYRAQFDPKSPVTPLILVPHYPDDPVCVRCDNGLVMWLPLEWPSEREANGMIMAQGSNKLHHQLVTNGSLSAGVSGIFTLQAPHNHPRQENSFGFILR